MAEATAAAQDIQNMTIADQSLICAQKFKLVTRQLQVSELGEPVGNINPKPDVALNNMGVSAEMLTDTWVRFNIWTANIGALSRGRASLDYRLRHADVREEVLRLLKHMNASLSHLRDIVSGVREQEVWYSTDEALYFSEGEFTDSESELEDDTDTSPENTHATSLPAEQVDVEPQRVTESHELLMAIGEALSGLFQLSIFIHKSTRRNKFASFTAERGQPTTQIDIRHVRDRFPSAAGNQDLIERLGKANARRRQWLLYKRRHREKLAGQAGVGLEPRPRRPNFPMVIGTNSAHHHDDDAPQLSPLAPSDSLASGASALSSTVASTLYGLPKLEPDTDDHSSESGYSETTYSESVRAESDIETTLVPQLPPESANDNPFECPYCFQIVTVSGRTSWTKHVHSDLASYICTHANCSHPPFESRHEWFNHELEVHRLQWFCEQCPAIMTSEKGFHKHIRENHSHLVQYLEAVTARSARPLQTILATDCPLCDYDALLKQRRRAGGIEVETKDPINLTLKHFRSHLGRHLEQLALFVLPRSQLMELPEDLAASIDGTGEKGKEGFDDKDDDSVPVASTDVTADDEELAVEVDSSLRLGVVESDQPLLDQIKLTLDSDWSISQSHVNRLMTAPELAMGWLPPMNFTPPEEDFHQDDVDLIPRREDSMFGGDLFTPGWVRGYGNRKEGFCGRCEPGLWLNLNDGSYEANLVYKHGIHSSGIPLARPSRLRQQDGEWQGHCDACQGWRTMRVTDMGWNWFRHCIKEHVPIDSSNPTTYKGESVTVAPEASMQDITHDQLNNLVANIKKQDVEGLRRILDQWPQFTQRSDPTGRTAVHYAADNGNIDILTSLLRAAGDEARKLIDCRTLFGDTALMLAAMQGNENAVIALIKADAGLDVVNNRGQTALDCATMAGYLNICKLLIDAGADILTSKVFCKMHHQKHQATLQASPSSPGSNDHLRKNDSENSITAEQESWTLLMVAAADGDMNAVKSSLETGADIEATTAKEAQTALMLAAANSHSDIIRLLLFSGANIDAVNVQGWTTLMLAARDNNPEVVSLLISYGADVNHLSPDRWTALAEATSRGYTGIMRLLLACKADTESRSMHDWTPLMHAAFQGDSDAVELLLAAGADMDVISLHDETALLLAAARKHTSICITLLAAGCSPEPKWVSYIEQAELDNTVGAQDRAVRFGWTPLMLACQNGLVEVVRMLLERQVKLQPRSPYGKTAFEIARENGQEEVTELFGG